MNRKDKNRIAAERIVARISQNLEISSARLGPIIRASKVEKEAFYKLVRGLRAR